MFGCYVIDVHLIDEFVSRLVKQKVAIAIMTIQSIQCVYTYTLTHRIMLMLYVLCVRTYRWAYVDIVAARARSCCLFCSVVRNATYN